MSKIKAIRQWLTAVADVGRHVAENRRLQMEVEHMASALHLAETASQEAFALLFARQQQYDVLLRDANRDLQALSAVKTYARNSESVPPQVARILLSMMER